MRAIARVAVPLFAFTFGCGRGHAEHGDAGSASPSAASVEPAGAPLADLRSEDSTVVRKAAERIAAEGDEATKRSAVPVLTDAVRRIGDKAWRDRARPKVVEANRITRLSPTEAQLEMQLDTYAAEEAAALLGPLAAIGGGEAIALLLEKAEDARAPVKLSRAAIDALTAHPPADKASQDRLAAAKVALAAREAPPIAAPMDAETARNVATVALGAISVEGGPVDGPGAVVAGMAAGFRRCYTKALEADASTQGTVTFTLTLDESGAVTSSKREAKLSGSNLVADCASARAESATFARPKKLPASVSFPVTFRRAP